MKIVVDEMPKTPQECRFSQLETCELTQESWIGCRKGQIVCCLETHGCPFYIGINQVKGGAE